MMESITPVANKTILTTAEPTEASIMLVEIYLVAE